MNGGRTRARLSTPCAPSVSCCAAAEQRYVVGRERMGKTTARAMLTVCIAVGCAARPPASGASASTDCNACPPGTYCATDVMIKDVATGKITCYPSYCVPGVDEFCKIDPESCARAPSRDSVMKDLR